ncbi:MAG: hypothetical protein GPJ54_05070 [Candidatus Heimdallarchaeota archaeon]|nr:hypothetical protein [Candidatus Heimdallarchaeota archaeon]
MSRLRKELDGELVNEVVHKLLLNTVKLVQELNIEPIILTSDKSLADKTGLDIKIIIDDGSSLNKAVDESLDVIDEDLVLFIMPDLPGLTIEILNKFLAVQSIHQYVIAPTHDKGTAMACLPSYIFKKNLFGRNSANLLIEACNVEKIQISVFETKNILHDLDTIEDWKLWEQYILKTFLENTK